MIENDILTPEECAELLRVEVSFVYEKTRKRQRNPLPCYRPGRYLRFSRRAVLAWLESTSKTNRDEGRGRKGHRAKDRN
jgi:excisionase family DNA binding protein